MPQTRAQAASASACVRPARRQHRRCLKEVRIPAPNPHTSPSINKEKEEQEKSAANTSSPQIPNMRKRKLEDNTGRTQHNPTKTTPVQVSEQAHLLASSNTPLKSNTNNNAPLQLAAVRTVFNAALQTPASPPTLQHAEILSALQFSIEDYITNMHHPDWQPRPNALAYAPNVVFQVLTELHRIAIRAATTTRECEQGVEGVELGVEALAHALLWGGRMLRGAGEQWGEGGTEMHMAVYGFVEQVVEVGESRRGR
ncbi:uncharacterized protein K460DRAFT_86561 [Cucurbitaria berberidis CBS 394.84]|uniref:Uncharacterized protein n=1 Tax=Cucurbitaria berberidis CBS 394.84 TaxID=1168544 RepID=A0A9P4GMJ7_9PLEO|nr:uncharacterized protein K460DRAFT_86561 [Cucurbitaria berberidis CBS 394.84]KAF1849168.1 hypothetical protein K460DRAFT_86561 [Cucurbitaria berberidis CBS 394.84]